MFEIHKKQIIIFSILMTILIVIYISIRYYISTSFITYGITKDKIRIGQTLDLSGTSIASLDYQLGITTAIDKCNREGGIHSKNIEIYSLDDGLVPERTYDNAKLLIEYYDCLTILGTYGTDCTRAILPYLSNSDVSLFGPLSGSNTLRNPFIKNVVNIRPSYINELEKIFSFMSEKNLRNISMFSISSILYSEIEDLIIDKYHNINMISRGTYDTTNPNDFFITLKDMLDIDRPYDIDYVKTNSLINKIDAIYILSTSNVAVRIIEYFKKIKPSIYIFISSFSDFEYLYNSIYSNIEKQYINNIYTTQILNLDKNSIIYKEFKNELQKNNKNININYKNFEGYICGKYFCELLKKIPNDKLNRKNLIDYVYKTPHIKFGEFDFKGFKYGISNQALSNTYLYNIEQAEKIILS